MSFSDASEFDNVLGMIYGKSSTIPPSHSKKVAPRTPSSRPRGRIQPPRSAGFPRSPLKDKDESLLHVLEEHAPSPAPSFVFGEIASPIVVPDVPRSVYPNFTNALSLAHRIGAKPTIETVKRLEVIERAKEEQRSLN